ncbi:MAG TPA: hypothetical protein PLR83_07250 [Pyrinomonadaceae bacterium]|nr:hypothetical protein [Pyrinomonadaceae bacterium]
MRESVDALLDRIRTDLAEDWLPELYRTKVRAQRTRSYMLDIRGGEISPRILYTLLGIELQVGKRRFACPDLATARYLRVFARLGCAEFAVPYDISKISRIADRLETSFQRALLVAADVTKRRTPRSAALIRRKLLIRMRDEIAAIGAGEPMPAFDTKTRQREK